jgi:hypothetical protein
VLPSEASRDTSDDVELDFDDSGEGESWNFNSFCISMRKVFYFDINLLETYPSGRAPRGFVAGIEIKAARTTSRICAGNRIIFLVALPKN